VGAFGFVRFDLKNYFGLGAFWLGGFLTRPGLQASCEINILRPPYNIIVVFDL